MIIAFITFGIEIFLTAISIIRENTAGAIFCLVLSVLLATCIGILVVAVIKENERLTIVKIFEEAKKNFFTKLEQEKTKLKEPFEEFNGVDNGKEKNNESGKSD